MLLNQVSCGNLELRHSKLGNVEHFKGKKDLRVEATILGHKMNIITFIIKTLIKGDRGTTFS